MCVFSETAETQSWGIISRKLKVKHAYEMKQQRKTPRHREFLSSGSAVDPRDGELVGVVVTLVSSDPVRSPPRVTERLLFRGGIESLHPASLPPHTHTHTHTPNSPTLPYSKLFVIPPPSGPAAVKRGSTLLQPLLKHLRYNRCYRHTGIIVELCTPCAAVD